METQIADRTAANRAVVAGLYEAFGRGDTDAILAVIDEDCRWEEWEDNRAQRGGISYLRPQRGPAGVGAFFGEVARFQMHEFRVLDILASDRQVAVEVLIEATSAHGGRFRDEELHLYTVNDAGRIVRMRHYVDTAKHLAAAGLEAPR